MIRTFRHKGLKELFERGATRRVEQNYIRRCNEILHVIHNATNIQQINLPGYVLHVLKPQRPNTWSVRVQGPWRITFEFRSGDAYDVDLEQHH
jgi:toxin HigB-1